MQRTVSFDEAGNTGNDLLTAARQTHATLLIPAGVPIKVVSERLGHAHPAFTMHTYQHVLPGMSAAAAEQFAVLVGTSNR